MTSQNIVIHFSKPSGPGRSLPSPQSSPDRRKLGSALKSTISKLLSPRRGNASCSTVAVVAASSGDGGGTSGSGGDREFGATGARPLGLTGRPSSDDWPIAIGPQTGRKSKMVIPVTAEIV